MVRKVMIVISAVLFVGGMSLWAGGQTGVEAEEESVVAMAGKYNEAPMLAEMVAKGELAPVDQRLPKEPFALAPLEEVGRYGGTIRVYSLDPNPWGDLQEEPERGNFFLRMLDDGTIVGDLAESYEFSDDARKITLVLREGLKWSDGEPLTADDVLFMYEDLHWEENVGTIGMQGLVKRVIKLDPYTVRFETDQPFPGIVQQFMDWGGSDWAAIAPKHYLQKWHIKYNTEADELAKEQGYDNWYEAVNHALAFAPRTDLDMPTTQPWIFKEATSDTKLFERNPYYHTVDTDGNQLPYIDKILTQVVDREVYHLKIISGEADVAFSFTSLENFTLYKESEASGAYRVVTLPGRAGSEAGFGFNQNHPDPVLGELLRNVMFRRALSLAINREEINKVIYFGLAVPRQGTVLSWNSYYKEEWGRNYADYDPGEANRMLDEIGLTKRDGDGFRIGSDGKTVNLLIESKTNQPLATELELVKEYWDAVGVKTTLKLEEPPLWRERRFAPDHAVMAHPMVDSDEISNYNGPGIYSPSAPNLGWAIPWNLWLPANEDVQSGRKTLADFEGGKLPGVEPPEQIKEMYDLFQRRKQTTLFSEEYKEISTRIYDIHAEELYMVGTVGMAPTVFIAKNNIGNIPKQYPLWACCSVVLNYYANQFFFKS
jgi:peptide/nickel transport system substrate-binding protein